MGNRADDEGTDMAIYRGPLADTVLAGTADPHGSRATAVFVPLLLLRPGAFRTPHASS